MPVHTRPFVPTQAGSIAHKSKRPNIYLTEFRKTRMFREKDLQGLGLILATLDSYDSPLSRHAFRVLRRWALLVLAETINSAIAPQR